MDWKPSKRQALLKKRLLDSSQAYWQTSRQLDQMLLRMLHTNGIYTPDDLHNWCLKDRMKSKVHRAIPVITNHKFNRQKTPKNQLNLALANLSVVLTQLKRVISRYYNEKS